MATLLTKEELDFLIKNQMLNEKNIEVRSLSELAIDFPKNMMKNIGITMTIGTVFTGAFSGYTFKRMDAVKSDLKSVTPILATFSTLDFGINYIITKGTGKKHPTRPISITSSSFAGAFCGWHFSNHKTTPTIFGGIAGGLYGAIRNRPLEMMGFEPF